MTDLTATPAGEPPWLVTARREIGVSEGAGITDNARVLAYYRDAGHSGVSDDSVAWCAAFACAMLERSGFASPRTLRARNFLSWGVSLEHPRPGCLAVLWRTSPSSTEGHVGFYTGEQNGRLLLLGGNQSDRVSIAPFPKSQVLGYRWPEAKPDSAAPTPSSEPIFEAALAHVLAMEGGWTDDPVDPGGPTNRGITLAEFARWEGVEVTAETIASLRTRLRSVDLGTARAIYHANYWRPGACAELPVALALFHFDCAVNQGVGRAARFLQTALGVEVDGEIGSITLAAASSTDIGTAIDAYADLRRAHYRSLSTFWRFGRGWLNRVDATRTAALHLHGTSPSPRKEPKLMPTNPQSDSKWWGQSMTIWGVVVTTMTTVLPVVARALGYDISTQVVQDLGAQLTTLFQAFGGVAGIVMTILGRARATQRLDLSPMPPTVPPFGPRNWRA